MELEAALPFSTDEMLEEFATELKAWLRSIEPCLVGNPCALLGTDMLKSTSELTTESIVTQPIVHDLTQLYRYGCYGEGLVQPEDHLEGPVHFLEETLKGFQATKALTVIRLATARWMLDTGDLDLTIDQIALLANMDEKSVRNAANPKNRDALKTYSHDGRTYVKVVDARDWLSRRRGFVPTRVVEGGLAPLPSEGFVSVADVRHYISRRIGHLDMGKGELNRRLKKVGISMEVFDAMKMGSLELVPRQLAAIAKVIELDPTEFAVKITRIAVRSLS